MKQGRSIKLTFGGNGPDVEMLKREAIRLGIVEQVEFSGPVFGVNKDHLWNNGHIFAFLPTIAKVCRMPYSEAMNAGAVPVTTRVGAIPDVMQHEVHGLFVEPRDVDGLASTIARLDDDAGCLQRWLRLGKKECWRIILLRDWLKIYPHL